MAIANAPHHARPCFHPPCLPPRHVLLRLQVNYPRCHSIRTKWLGRRVFELVIVLTAMVLLVNQYIEPAVANSMTPLQQVKWGSSVGRCGKYGAGLGRLVSQYIEPAVVNSITPLQQVGLCVGRMCGGLGAHLKLGSLTLLLTPPLASGAPPPPPTCDNRWTGCTS